MRRRVLQLDPPAMLPAWIIDELSREQHDERVRPSLNIDGEIPVAPAGDDPHREQAPQSEGAEEAPSTVIIIPI
jgi:hypothetical protein